MSKSLQGESFAAINLRERSSINAGALLGASTIQVVSTQGFDPTEPICLGVSAREGCEKASTQSIVDETTIQLTAPLKQAHARFEMVQAVLGDHIRIYRAVNVDGTPPLDQAFSVLASSLIDPDQVST